MGKTAFAVMLLVASVGLCQTPVKGPDTLQSLLVEVHQLRQDIEAMTVASQRVQIALYALQMQDAAVVRASQRFDDARYRRLTAEANRAQASAAAQRLESRLSTGTIGEAEAKELQSALPQMKSDVEAKTALVLTCQIEEGEASGQLRNDQAKLSDLQDRIERLDKSLEKLGAAGK